MKQRAAVALTWDGARWPARLLSAKARSFLGDVTARPQFDRLMENGGPQELRICWVPKLKGGPLVLCGPFLLPDPRRIAMRLVRRVTFEDCLGVVYAPHLVDR